METLSSYNMANVKTVFACGMMLRMKMSVHERGCAGCGRRKWRDENIRKRAHRLGSWSRMSMT